MTQTLSPEKQITGFTFDQPTHIGRMNGVIWPSVTQLIKEAGYIDYSGVPPKILENKSILGTRVHAGAALLDDAKFGLDEEHFNSSFPECVPYLDAYKKFREIEKFDKDERVGRLVSNKWKFHGQPDEHGVHVQNIGGELSLIDYKCTFKMFASTGPQLSGYKILLWECFKIKIKKQYGLLLKPTGHYDLVKFNDPNDEQDFKAALWIWWQRVNKYKTLNPETALLQEK